MRRGKVALVQAWLKRVARQNKKENSLLITNSAQHTGQGPNVIARHLAKGGIFRPEGAAFQNVHRNLWDLHAFDIELTRGFGRTLICASTQLLHQAQGADDGGVAGDIQKKESGDGAKKVVKAARKRSVTKPKNDLVDAGSDGPLLASGLPGQPNEGSLLQELVDKDHDIGEVAPPASPGGAAVASQGRAAGETLSESSEEAGVVSEQVSGVPVVVADPEKMLIEMMASISRNSAPLLLRSSEKDTINNIFRRFTSRGWAANQALALYINSKFFPVAAAKFRRFMRRALTPDLRDALMRLGATSAAEAYLFPLFAEYCFEEFPEEIKSYRELVNSADMTKPHTWYPFARASKRKIIYHRGPTNSGKTYAALKRFRAAKSGVYCGPLRLLAMEVFDTVNHEGTYCNLVTGQERHEVPFANHTSCTIEMANVFSPVEVAVIDEIQMIGDELRGWAWTRALLGLQADEIHLCGDPSVLPLLQALCAATGDEFVHYDYQRFMPLKVDVESLNGDFRNAKPGDCIVAFSRREIFHIKREVEMLTKHRCCVVYGALPPETRRQQARLFNQAGSPYDILIASDAVGMGLNLNIRRVVFFAMHKFNGTEKVLIPAPMVKQIAGRAGRHGSLFPEGVATTFFKRDSRLLAEALQQPVEDIHAAGLFPFFEQVELFASQLPEVSFAKLIFKFAETTKLDGSYFMCSTHNLRKVASLLDKIPGLSLEDRFKFCFAPANLRDMTSMATLVRYAATYAENKAVPLRLASPPGGTIVREGEDGYELLDLETKHQVLSMYLWLSQQFPEGSFPEQKTAAHTAAKLAEELAAHLAESSNAGHSKQGRKGSKSRFARSSRAGSYPWSNRDEGDSNYALNFPLWKEKGEIEGILPNPSRRPKQLARVR